MTTATIAKERPILFSGDMVLAILEGRKTQTRRIIKPQPVSLGDQIWQYGDDVFASDDSMQEHLFHEVYGTRGTPYGSLYESGGDRIWVRETWQYFGGDEYLYQRDKSSVAYRATHPFDFGWTPDKWRPSIFMPRWASRITLEITDVGVERLQEINEHDAEAEGLYRGAARRHLWWRSPGLCRLVEPYRDHKRAFADLWDEINFKRAPWSQNPLVWRIEFKVCKG